MNQHDIIAVFQYAQSNLHFSIEDLVAKNVVTKETATYILQHENRDERYFQRHGSINSTYVMTIEGHLALINYLSMEQARKSTQIGFTIAIIALLLAVIVGVIQIVVML